MHRIWALLAAGGLMVGCGAAPGADQPPVLGGDICRVTFAGVQLPREVRETSGLVESGRVGGLFWTHNDGKTPELFAIRSDGSMAGRVRIAGVQLRDWEDLGAGPCASGTCLYLADIGDNGGERTDVTIAEVPEPAPDATQAEVARVLRLRYPDGAHDAEALFRMPDGELYIVTKGRQSPIVLYRVPRLHDSADIAVLEAVKQLAPQPTGRRDWVTSATANADGKWIAVRTYRTLWFYRADELLGAGEAKPITVDLSPLRERQGESVAFARDGSVWLTSESEDVLHQPTWSRLVCTLP